MLSLLQRNLTIYFGHIKYNLLINLLHSVAITFDYVVVSCATFKLLFPTIKEIVNFFFFKIYVMATCLRTNPILSLYCPVFIGPEPHRV